MDVLFCQPDPRHGGGRTVVIVGTKAHGQDTESLIESSVYIQDTSGPNPSRKLQEASQFTLWAKLLMVTFRGGNMWSSVWNDRILYLYSLFWCVHSWSHAHWESNRSSGVLLPNLGPRPLPQRRRHFLPLSGELDSRWWMCRFSNQPKERQEGKLKHHQHIS